MTRPQRRDRLQVAAILVAKREPVQEIFDGDETRTLEIGGAARTDTLQELQRRRQEWIRACFDERVRKGVGPLLAHCTIMACPRPTWISRMRAGSANESSRLIPAG